MARPHLELEAEARSLFAGDPPHLDGVAALIAGLCEVPPAEGEIGAALDGLADTAPAVCTDPEAVLNHVFVTLGFRGNTRSYYDPDNSYLHRVIETRLGIPITLSLIAVEVGRRLGVGLDLVGFPGHVLIGDRLRADRWFDPFEPGRVLDRAACQDLLDQHFPGATLQAEHTQVLTPAEVAHRMLNNLKAIHLSHGNPSAALAAARLAIALPGSLDAHRIELARLLASTGRFDEAARQHELLAESDPSDAEDHRRAALRLRAHYN